MADKLTDPSKPAQAIIEVLEDGDAIRNDGVRLTAANKNPWYVLATIYGEQEEGGIDPELAAKNRRAWNGWFCGGLSDEDRADRAKKTGLEPEELGPLSKVDLAEIKKHFAARMGKGAQLPQNDGTIDFSKAIFSKPLSFEHYVFEQNVSFDCAKFNQNASFTHACFRSGISCKSAVFNGFTTFLSTVFGGYADFSEAMFNGPAHFSEAAFDTGANFDSVVFADYSSFRSARFDVVANFDYASFCGKADFKDVVFVWQAMFSSAKFKDTAWFNKSEFKSFVSFHSAEFDDRAYFNSALFNEEANFGSTTFNGIADFSSTKFNSTTEFKNAHFKSYVPKFYAAELYDETVFSTPDKYTDNWPPLPSKDKIAAEDQKRAYNRLRLFMNKSLQIDEEQFFHRQEMRCKTVLAKWYHKPFYWLFALLSDYGNSVWRPLLWMIFVMLSGALFMLWWQEAFTFLPKEASGFDWTMGLLGEDDPLAKPREAAGWSILNTLPFLGFGKLYYGELTKELAWPLKVVGGVQTVFGFVLLFFLGLGLRNRFRLR